MTGKKNVDSALQNVTASLVYYDLQAFIAVATLNHIGVQSASFAALIGAAGFLILVSHPFRVGDFVEFVGIVGRSGE